MKNTFLMTRLFYLTFKYLMILKFQPDRVTELKKRWALDCLKTLGFDLHINGQSRKSEKLILVGNHISFVDIFVIMASHPETVFLAKSEVQNWPIIGAAAKAVGTLFVRRDSKESKQNSKFQIAELLKNAKNPQLVVFPSGTTCLYEELQWKKGIFEIAQLSDISIQAFRIDYSKPRECAYIDDDTLISSIHRILNTKEKNVYLTWGSDYLIQDPLVDLDRIHKAVKNKFVEADTNTSTQL